MTYHLLFEQTNTFRNVFRSLGYEAYSYDIAGESELSKRREMRDIYFSVLQKLIAICMIKKIALIVENPAQTWIDNKIKYDYKIVINNRRKYGNASDCFSDVGDYGNWWSATEDGAYYVKSVCIPAFSYDIISERNGKEFFFFSVRRVRNERRKNEHSI